MVGQVGGLGEEIFERRPLDFFHLAVRAVAGVKIILEKRAEVDLFEGIFLFDRSDGVFFVRSRSGALAVFFFAANFVEQRNRFFKFLENRVLDHLSVDHVLELKLVEREDGDHLHQAGSKDLALGQLYTEFVLQQNHELGLRPVASIQLPVVKPASAVSCWQQATGYWQLLFHTSEKLSPR